LENRAAAVFPRRPGALYKALNKMIGEDNMAATKEEILDAIASMTVLEVSELVKAMEEKFGVSAAAPVAVAAAAAPGAAAAEAVEEKTEFTVVLKAFDDTKKIAVIKEVRAVTGLGLKEAKDLVEGAPKPLKENVSKEEAAKIKDQVTAAGGTVEIQ
jgi:large subunit ribosomal protein L7/L12